MKVTCLNPSTVYWMDILTHSFDENFVSLSCKRSKMKEKRPGMAHFLTLLKRPLYYFTILPPKCPE